MDPVSDADSSPKQLVLILLHYFGYAPDWNVIVTVFAVTVILYFCNHTPLVILVCEDVESNPDPKSWNSPSDLSNFHLNIRSMRNQLH